MQYSHQAQLSEIIGLPTMEAPPVTFWRGNLQYLIAARHETDWSLLESYGSLVGEFVAHDGGFAIVDYDGGEMARFDHWRSAVRHILRRGLLAA